MRPILLTAAVSSLLLTSCVGKIGPHAMKTDGLQYNRSLQKSVDDQLLLNIVRLKYRENPVFLDVGTISSAYELKRGASAGLEYRFEDDTLQSMLFKPNFAVECTDKPTTVYSPVKGENLVKQMMSPIPLQTVYLLNSSGWRIDRILRTCVQRMNHLKNAVSASRPTPSLAPEYKDFLELTKLLHQLELTDDVDIVAEKSPNSDKFDFVILIDQEADRKTVEKIWELLKLTPETYVIRMVPFHSREHVPNEVLVDTRSPMSILYFLSQGVHAPECDQINGLVTTTRDAAGNYFDWDDILGGIITIHSGPVNDNDAAISVMHRGSTFYIRDDDLTSKSTFSMLSQLLSLQTGNPTVPVLTLQLN